MRRQSFTSFFDLLSAPARLLNDRERSYGAILLNELERESITLYAACLLPDHLHAIVSPGNKAVPTWVKNFKSYSMQQVRVSYGESFGWQPDYYDRILRSEIEFQETARYILDNPVEAGLCADSSDWPWTFVREA